MQTCELGIRDDIWSSLRKPSTTTVNLNYRSGTQTSDSINQFDPVSIKDADYRHFGPF